MVKVQEFMERMGIKTQADLGRLVGVGQSAVSAWNSGVNGPTYETSIKLLRMGMTLDELYGESFGYTRDGSQGKTTTPEDDFDNKVRLSMVKLLEKLYVNK